MDISLWNVWQNSIVKVLCLEFSLWEVLKTQIQFYYSVEGYSDYVFLEVICVFQGGFLFCPGSKMYCYKVHNISLWCSLLVYWGFSVFFPPLINLARDFKFLQQLASGFIDFPFFFLFYWFLRSSFIIFFHLLALDFICSSFSFSRGGRGGHWFEIIFLVNIGISVTNVSINIAVVAT